MKIKSKNILFFIVLLFIAFLMYSFYFVPAVSVSKGAGTVLSDNWWEALNWIQNNTPTCAVVATYWDPGHFITGIAKRPIIFGGASQNAVFTIDKEGNLTEDEIKALAITDKYTIQKTIENGTLHTIITRARIQDIGKTLMTDNEILAYEILKQYREPECNEMYFIASSDLIGKSHWWTYFATWNPVDKGTAYEYLMLNLAGAKPIIQQNAIAYTYSFAQNQAFVLLEQNGTIKPFLQQGNQFATVEKIFYFKNGVGGISENQDSQVKGMIWLDPSKQVMVFIPPQLENSMFTRMFFFNGAGLQNFEFVNSWGGEFKLFRLRFT